MADLTIEPEPWGDPETLRALEAASANGLPVRSVALYARWWQLETWLRELVYVELRARDGRKWVDSVKTAIGRQNQDAAFTHMSSADSANPLAYLDYSQLLQVIDADWDLFKYALLNEPSWEGRQEELKRIRHRIGHMRRPHPDDLGRLEQTLRDLEGGTFVALASYNRERYLTPKQYSDPVTKGWVAGKHPTAMRLIAHAERQYDTSFELTYSLRPWAEPVGEAGPDGHPGAIWKAHFTIGGSRRFNLTGFWRDFVRTQAEPYLLHALVDGPWSLTCTFAAVDGGESVANSIGTVFDCLVTNARRVDEVIEGDEVAEWNRRAQGLDYRVLVSSGWEIVSNETVPISLFGAGGGTTVVPSR
jgi:hypothetical protein